MVYRKTGARLKRNTTILFWAGQLIFSGILLFSCATALAQKPKPPEPLVSFRNGVLVHLKDSLGNRVPDFSYAGYMGGEMDIPFVNAVVKLGNIEGDATQQIQRAIDHVSKLKPGPDGFRGAVLLAPGTYKVSGGLKLSASGIVLRGSGMGENGTILLGAGHSRETLVEMMGEGNRKEDAATSITDPYVPVNETRLTVKDNVFKKGDQVIVERPFTEKWISVLGTEHFGGGITSLGWKPMDRSIRWDRTIIAVNGNTITLDAPVTTALDSAYGGATVRRYNFEGRISKCGIENMRLVSDYDRQYPKEEDHRWIAISIDNATDCWVRQVQCTYFASSAVSVLSEAKRITVEDCIWEKPVSENGGWRRIAFFTEGQQTLFQRCFADSAMHAFATGYCAAGPNVFVQCEAMNALGFSGGINSWSAGTLMDVVNIDGNALRFKNLGQDKNGAGWAAANSVFWNCSAARIDCYKPPTAQNWAFGSWSQFSGDGYWNESNNTIQPRSLYYQQLKERLSKDMNSRAALLPLETDATSSPTYEQAAALTELAKTKMITLKEWILKAHERNPISTYAAAARAVEKINSNWTASAPDEAPLVMKNGMLVFRHRFAGGPRFHVQWWNGNLRNKAITQANPHITRFVPGKSGKGYTDRINEVVSEMTGKGVIALDHNYGLWYERRRDDHERIRRMDGDVWPPFYELPFARSGVGTAWDGLSKYDLTRYNHFYWDRLKAFATAAEKSAKVLFHQHYFQHNILEAGAHYADFPWRTANNINNTPFAEPVPYAGDKRIFLAEQFYDVSDSSYRELHRKYIRQSLSNFAGNKNVIHFISAEYTGPLHFVEFWLDVIAEWQRETGEDPLIALSVTKDVQDAILADQKRAALVDVIDIRYWHYQSDGKLYAPKGGKQLAPRQHARVLKPKGSSNEQVYRAVSEYRNRFPEKAVLYSGDGYDRFGWGALMAGASLPAVKYFSLAGALPFENMKPVQDEHWRLQGTDGAALIYKLSDNPIVIDLSAFRGKYTMQWIDTETGNSIASGKLDGGKKYNLKTDKKAALLLIQKGK